MKIFVCEIRRRAVRVLGATASTRMALCSMAFLPIDKLFAVGITALWVKIELDYEGLPIANGDKKV